MNNIDLPALQKLQIGKWPTTSARRREMQDFMNSDIVRRQAWTNLIRNEELLIVMDRYDELHMNAGRRSWYYNRDSIIIDANDLEWIKRLQAEENIAVASKLIIDVREPNSSLKVIQTADLFNGIHFLSIHLSDVYLNGNSIIFDYFLATRQATNIPSLYEKTNVEISLWGKNKQNQDEKSSYLFFEKEHGYMETNIVRLVLSHHLKYLSLVANGIEDGEAHILLNHLVYADRFEFIKVETENIMIFNGLCQSAQTEQGIQITNDEMKYLATSDKVEVTFMIIIKMILFFWSICQQSQQMCISIALISKMRCPMDLLSHF